MRHCLLTAVLLTASLSFAQINAPSVVARVNGADITRTELNEAVVRLTARALPPGQSLDAAQRAEVEPMVLDQLIGDRLLTLRAATLTIEGLNAKVQEHIAVLKKQFADEQAFVEMMKTNQLDEAKLKEKVAESIRVEALLDREVRGKITVSDADAKSFYEKNPEYFSQPAQVRASHILVKVASDADDKTKAGKRAAIDAARKRVTDGEDFAKVAGEVSDCPSKAQGGDLGFFGDRQMVQPFSEAAFALKSNEVSQVVTTQFGYHIIKRTGNKPASTVPFEQESKKIVAFLTQQRMAEALPAYIAALRKDAKVEVLLK